MEFRHSAVHNSCLIKLVTGDGDETEVLCSLETGNKSFKNLPEVVEHHRHVFKGTSEQQ